MNDLTCMRDFSPTGLLRSFEPANKVLLKIWVTASPECQLGEKWTGPGDVLLTTPTVVKLAEIKPWTHHTRIKKALEDDLKVIFKKTMTCVLFIISCLTPCYGQLVPFQQVEDIWVYLAKIVLDISDFCFAGGTYV